MKSLAGKLYKNLRSLRSKIENSSILIRRHREIYTNRKVEEIDHNKVLNQNIQMFRLNASSYEAIQPCSSNIFEQRRLRKEIKKLVSEGDMTKPILDLGSGTGNLIRHLKKLGVDAIACDISPDMLKINPANYKVLCDATHLPFRDGYFGAIVSYSVFHHFPDPNAVMKELCRVASSNCILYLDHDPFTPLTKLKPFTKDSIAGWAIGLILNPGRVIKVLKYLLWGRQRHLRNIVGLGHSENLSRVKPLELVSILKTSSFEVNLVDYKGGSYLKAHRNGNNAYNEAERREVLL